MAKTPKPGKRMFNWLPKLKGTVQQARTRAREDALERKAAGQHPHSIILTPKDVQGDYDAHRLLTTTLGGRRRALTRDDLRTFRRNVDTVQRKYTGGIRARDVLDLSESIDRERANKEIRSCAPVSSSGGTVRFLTNSGPDSDVPHHHVTVEFPSFSAVVAGARGREGDGGKQAAQQLRKERLKIECDCGRWRYWYRYMATIGKYNAGRDESGYPKIRNPNLKGVACKHIVRVMAEVEKSGTVLNFLTRMVDKARERDSAKVQVQSKQAEAEQAIAKRGRTRDVESSMRARQKAKEMAAARRKEAANKTAAKRATATSRQVERALKTLAAAHGISDEQLRQLLATAQA